MRDTTTETVYAHKATWEGPPLAELVGATVYNAPRPLLGDPDRHGTWTGEFRRGIFYAAIWPDTAVGEKLVRANLADDAAEVRFVDNADIERILTDQLAKDGYSLADYHEIGMTTQEAAHHHGLPWHE